MKPSKSVSDLSTSVAFPAHPSQVNVNYTSRTNQNTHGCQQSTSGYSQEEICLGFGEREDFVVVGFWMTSDEAPAEEAHVTFPP